MLQIKQEIYTIPTVNKFQRKSLALEGVTLGRGLQLASFTAHVSRLCAGQTVTRV